MSADTLIVLVTLPLKVYTKNLTSFPLTRALEAIDSLLEDSGINLMMLYVFCFNN